MRNWITSSTQLEISSNFGKGRRTIQKGTLVASRDIVFHATSMVIKQLIAVEGRTEKHNMILMLTSLVI